MCVIVKATHNEYVQGEEILYKPLNDNKDIEENKKIEKYDIFKNDIYDKLMNELSDLFRSDLKYYTRHFTNKYFIKKEKYISQYSIKLEYIRKCNGDIYEYSPIIKNIHDIQKYDEKCGIEILHKTYRNLRVKDLKRYIKINDPDAKISKTKKLDLIKILMKL